ncbi:MAG TPA: anti-sigma factor [Saprospiraceae bacterium]|nr:anti-sigma factor [Saprospiraceae bacterium]
MTIEEIRSSGLLEYYILDLLSESERQEVEGYLQEFPELRKDKIDIENALHNYAKAMGIEPRQGVEDNILDSIRQMGGIKSPTVSPPPASAGFGSLLPWLTGLLALTLIIGAYSFFNLKGKMDQMQSTYADSQAKCDSLRDEQNKTIDLLRKINDPDSRKLIMSATPGFQETQLFFHINDNSKENYIQIRRLPLIAENEVFQLWSLKDGINPIPLSTFRGDGTDIIPVDFENGTGTYAITIEPRGGSLAPNLAKLICTVGV